MNTSPPTSAAARAPASVAPALLERHKSALRSYVQALSREDAAKVEALVEAVWQEAHQAENAEFDDDPTVWLFANARRRVVGSGQREALGGENGGGSTEDEAGAEGEEPRVVVHRTIGNLTSKQQETLRLKFQFHLDLEEIATITAQPKSGIMWLLHHAVARIGAALGARDDDASPLANDPRVTAYALDEMDASERGFFEKGVGNGQALLEREKAIRAWSGHITEVLSSGAPAPRRRRKKRGAAWWQAKSLWLGVAAAAVVAGLLWFRRGPPAADAARDGATPPGTIAAEAAPDDRTGANAGDEAESGRSVFDGAKKTRPIPARNSAGPAATGRPKNAKPTGSDGRATANPQAKADPDGDFFRTKALPAKRAGQADADVIPKKPATATNPRTDTAAMFAGKPVAGAVGSGGGATQEIEVTGNIPGKGKPAEEVDVRPAMGALQRQLLARQWPRRGQVSIGALLKQVPKAGVPTAQPIEARLELMRSPWDGRKQVARVSFRAKDSPAPARGAANVVFAIDVSKSMAGPNRLPLVQEGVRRLVERLRPDDLISVVTYAEKAELALEAQPAQRAAELRACLGGLDAAGRTNGSAGLRLAYATARQHWVEGGMNVVVLCTDGNFNLGTTDESALAALAAAEAEHGVRLSVFGFGRTDRNDLRLEVLARNGGGRSCYVNTEEEAERQLVEQIDGLFAPVATDVHLRVEFNDSVVAEHRRIGDGADQETSGEVAALLPGRSVTVLFELTPAPEEHRPGKLGVLQLAYTLPETGKRQQENVTLDPTEAGGAKAGIEFKFAVAMAEFGRILREGRPASPADLDRLEVWVRENLTNDAGGYRAELLENLALARSLVQVAPAAVVAR